MSQDYMFSRGKGYIVEWVDSINFAGWHSLSEAEKIARKKENTNITYGEYVGDSEDGLYISLAQSFDSKKNAYLNINKVLREGVIAVNEIEKGVSSIVQKTTILAILAVTILAVFSHVFYSEKVAEAERVLCSSFRDQAAVQMMLTALPRLDGDKDGIACETLLQ